MKQTLGIHHISAIVGHPQETVAFYSNLLGLRLVKKTITFDEPADHLRESLKLPEQYGSKRKDPWNISFH